MDSPLALGSQSPKELEEHRAAEQRGDPFLVYRDGDGRQRIVVLDERRAPVTLGRRSEADVSLPWDPEVSRVHAELSFRAGEWSISDDGWSQNGTWVNGLRLAGRRRLADGDLIAVGRTNIAYCSPRPVSSGATIVSGDLAAAPRFSDQQQRILRALCAPLLGDGEGVLPASDGEVADATGIPIEVVATELDLLGRTFGLEDLPRSDRRAEIAMLAVRSGLVS